ncbi:hypothetical protein [Acinetobacter venetianus]|uniref:hypothetical protein n=1 Tax=Acinetobacter venetianus TaxID=52133 RepID=UPI0035BE69B7
MNMVGFCGGGLMHESGTPNEIQIFFETLKFVEQVTFNDLDCSLVLDRLYRRYVRFEDIDKTKQVMDYYKTVLVKKSEDESSNPLLKYFRHFDSSVSSALSFYQAFGEYLPVKISVVDLPWYLLEKHRPLEEYDQLEGEPFWMRDYTQEEVERLSNL